MSKISVTTIAGLTSGGDANKVKIEDGDTLALADNTRVKLGTGDDIQIYHDGTYSRIMESGGTALVLDTTSTDIRLTADNSKNMGTFVKDGAVQLYHSNSQKFSTASTGVNITGGIGLGGTGSANILDDYEEGTYTGVASDQSGGTITLNGDNTFNYTKIGRMVFVVGNLNRNDGTNYTSTLRVSLPFTSSNVTNANGVNGGVWLDGTGTDKVALVYIGRNQSLLNFKDVDSSDYVTSNEFQNSRPLYTSFFYFTDA